MKKINLYITFALLSGVISACNQQDPEACFTVSNLESFTPSETFQFSDCSQDSDTYLWDFGDGVTSTDASPEHVYNNYGNYKVTLTTKNDEGESTHFEYVKIGKPRLVTGQVVSYTNSFLDPDSIWIYFSNIVNGNLAIGSAPSSGTIEPISSLSAQGSGTGHFNINEPLRLYHRYAIGNSPAKPDSFQDTYIGSFTPDILNQKEYSAVIFSSNLVHYEVNLTFELDPDFDGI